MFSCIFYYKASDKSVTCLLYNKADWDGFKEFMQGFSDEIYDRTPLSGEENENDAESLWQAFKSQLHLGINKFIPSKLPKG